MTAEATVGHGHVVPRADGVKARCGGPPLCFACVEEQRALDAEAADSSTDSEEA